MTTKGVSFVVPVLNGRRHLRKVLNAILREADGHPFEVIVVDDGSTDASRVVIDSVCRRTRAPIRIVAGAGRGAAGALNAGIREAQYPFIAQIDQDVVIGSGWLQILLERLERDTHIAAAQGRFIVPSTAGFWARMSGRDLDVRYADLTRRTVDHVCTGNTVYRASAVYRIDLFDERLGYGYDNDASYRLLASGATLAFCPDATAEHHWREGVAGYLRHQFGVGYGRLDLVRAHPRRCTGDAVSGALMISHAPVTIAAIALAATAVVWPVAAVYAFALLAALAGERAIAALRAWRLTGDSAVLLFPAAHLLRDVSWAAATVIWISRQFTGGSLPSHSMPRRRRIGGLDDAVRVLVLIPAYNEAENLPAVIEELRRDIPDAEALVIDDASTDDTERVLATLGVKRLVLTERLGVGGALRAGVRYAMRRDYGIVARMDGDGQHRGSDLARLIRLVRRGRADAATGSRYLSAERASRRAMWQQVLSAVLSLATRTRVTDPTSGIWAFGPRALRLLDREHPGGYPEPELRLLLAKRGLFVTEIPVRVRQRQAGRTSLTPRRSTIAFARTALALVLSAAEILVASRE
jgi:glycosyltransferase involved in cell wall biosynthesis